MTHSYVWYDSFIRGTWLIYTCDMTHLHVWHDSFKPALVGSPELVKACCFKYRKYVWHDLFIRVTWLMHTCDMANSCGWHQSCIRAKRMIQTCILRESLTRRKQVVPKKIRFNTCIYTYNYMYVHTHTHIYTYIYIYI